MKASPTPKEQDSWEINVRLDPESRLCHRFDATGLALFPTGDWDPRHRRDKPMGVPVMDDFPQEHMQ